MLRFASMGVGISVDVHSIWKLGIEFGGARRGWCWPASRSVDGFPLANPESGQAQAATTQHLLKRVALSFRRVASGRRKRRDIRGENRRVQKEQKRSGMTERLTDELATEILCACWIWRAKSKCDAIKLKLRVPQSPTSMVSHLARDRAKRVWMRLGGRKTG